MTIGWILILPLVVGTTRCHLGLNGQAEDLFGIEVSRCEARCFLVPVQAKQNEVAIVLQTFM